MARIHEITSWSKTTASIPSSAFNPLHDRILRIARPQIVILFAQPMWQDTSANIRLIPLRYLASLVCFKSVPD